MRKGVIKTNRQNPKSKIQNPKNYVNTKLNIK